MNSSVNLVKKEVRQNLLIYIIPIIFLATAWILNLRQADWMTSEWSNIFGIILPIALAGAYGLQAFDLEENGQTRDFLMTKPLTINQIIYSKFFSGLLLLLIISVLWLLHFIPNSFTFPVLSDFPSVWLWAFLMITIATYTASFTTGLLVKGPIKLLVAIFISLLSVAWILFTWCEFLTVIFFSEWSNNALAYSLLILFITIGLTIFTISFYLKWVYWRLFQLPIINFKKMIITLIIFLIFMPLLFFTANFYNPPAVRPFNNLMATLFKAEKWFIAIEGVKQPEGSLLAFVDAVGDLGLGKIGEKPKIVYQDLSIPDKQIRIDRINWSPDGQKLAFSVNHQIKIYDLITEKTSSFIQGDIPLWSVDGNFLLTGLITKNEPQNSEWGSVTIQTIKLTLTNLKDKTQSNYGELTTRGNSLFWDSTTNSLLAVDVSGILKIINFSNRQINDLQLFSNEMVFSSKIIPNNHESDRSIEIIIFSFPIVDGKIKLQNYNISRFNYNSTNQSIKLISSIKQKKYKDVIFVDNGLLGRLNQNGVYHLIPVR